MWLARPSLSGTCTLQHSAGFSRRLPERTPFRLLRDGAYPPLRGTYLELEQGTILYSRGSVPYYRTYPGLYVPRPLMLRPYHQESTLTDLSRETLALTKMNWNSTQFDGLLPITIRAARSVGRILKHVSAGSQEIGRAHV